LSRATGPSVGDLDPGGIQDLHIGDVAPCAQLFDDRLLVTGEFVCVRAVSGQVGPFDVDAGAALGSRGRDEGWVKGVWVKGVGDKSQLFALGFGFHGRPDKGLDDVSLHKAPVPAAIALLGVGLAGIGFANQCKRGKDAVAHRGVN